jgi:hypothetical protein
MSRRGLLLHIGLHRTGTTSLQSFLASNRRLLANLGWLYPLSPIPENSSAHHLLSWKLAGLAQTRSMSLEGILARLRGEIDAQPGNLILSSEDFSRLDGAGAEDLRELFEDFDARVILYLRRQDLRIESYFHQRVAGGFLTQPFAHFLEESLASNDYLQIARRWANTFGQDRTIIRVVERGQVTDTRDDFLTQLGLEGRAAFVQVEKRNVSPTPEVTEHLRRLNIAREDGSITCDDGEFRERYQRPLIRRLSTRPRGLGASYLSYDERVELLRRFRDSNDRVASEFLGRDRLFFDEPTPDRPVARAETDLSLAELLNLVDDSGNPGT